ncbi:MAG TPA: SDR family oxidoreductase [Pseudomonadales bacterium]|nr:SDR family oxidoreductase [Pseudomonadales bacterium]
MDLGIAGRTALVCGASKGLGYGCAEALAREGVDVTIVARDATKLAEAEATLRALRGGRVLAVQADVTSADGRAAMLAACPQPDIVVNNAGGPPPGDFRAWDRNVWLAALDANMLAPIELIRATIDGMLERGFGRIVNITSHMVKEPVAMLGLSNGARAGLTGFVAGLARDVVARGVTINNLLPGQFDTDRLRSNHEKFAARMNVAPEEQRERARNSVPARRFGTPAEFGAACAFLCSAHAGFITGQNILLDGGQYRGLM